MKIPQPSRIVGVSQTVPRPENTNKSPSPVRIALNDVLKGKRSRREPACQGGPRTSDVYAERLRQGAKSAGETLPDRLELQLAVVTVKVAEDHRCLG